MKAKLLKSSASVFSKQFNAFLMKEVVEADWDADNLRGAFDNMLTRVQIELKGLGLPTCFIDCWDRYCRKQHRYFLKYISQADSITNVYTTNSERKMLLLTVSQPLFYSHMVDLDHINTELNGELESELSRLDI